MQLQDVGHVSCIYCTVLRNTLAHSHSTRYTDTLRGFPALTSDQYINLYRPNVNYSWRTAPLTSKIAFYIFIKQI